MQGLSSHLLTLTSLDLQGWDQLLMAHKVGACLATDVPSCKTDKSCLCVYGMIAMDKLCISWLDIKSKMASSPTEGELRVEVSTSRHAS